MLDPIKGPLFVGMDHMRDLFSFPWKLGGDVYNRDHGCPPPGINQGFSLQILFLVFMTPDGFETSELT